MQVWELAPPTLFNMQRWVLHSAEADKIRPQAPLLSHRLCVGRRPVFSPGFLSTTTGHVRKMIEGLPGTALQGRSLPGLIFCSTATPLSMSTEGSRGVYHEGAITRVPQCRKNLALSPLPPPPFSSLRATALLKAASPKAAFSGSARLQNRTTPPSIDRTFLHDPPPPSLVV